MRPTDRTFAQELDEGLRTYDKQVRSLPGIQASVNRQVFLEQRQALFGGFHEAFKAAVGLGMAQGGPEALRGLSAEIVRHDLLDAHVLQVMDGPGLVVVDPPPAGDAAVQFVQVGLEFVFPAVFGHLHQPAAMLRVWVPLGLQLAVPDVLPDFALGDIQTAGSILNRQFFHTGSV